jgi:hypothetical protein
MGRASTSMEASGALKPDALHSARLFRLIIEDLSALRSPGLGTTDRRQVTVVGAAHRVSENSCHPDC